MPDLRAAYRAGSLDKVLKDAVPIHRGAAAGDDLLHHNRTQGDYSDSMELQEPESDEWSEGNFE